MVKEKYPAVNIEVVSGKQSSGPQPPGIEINNKLYNWDIRIEEVEKILSE